MVQAAHPSTVLGPENEALKQQNPDTIAPPETDHGDAPSMKWPFSLSHNRVLTRARQQNSISVPSVISESILTYTQSVYYSSRPLQQVIDFLDYLFQVANRPLASGINMRLKAGAIRWVIPLYFNQCTKHLLVSEMEMHWHNTAEVCV